MKNAVKIFFRITIIVLALLFTDGIHYLLIAGDRIHFELTHSKSGETEIPDNHHINPCADTEKWISDDWLPGYDVQLFSHSLYSTTTKSEEFSNSIWQPPQGS